MIINDHVIKTSKNYVVTGDNYTFVTFATDVPQVKKPKPVKVNTNDNDNKTGREFPKRPEYMDERKRHNKGARRKCREDNVN